MNKRSVDHLLAGYVWSGDKSYIRLIYSTAIGVMVAVAIVVGIIPMMLINDLNTASTSFMVVTSMILVVGGFLELASLDDYIRARRETIDEMNDCFYYG